MIPYTYPQWVRTSNSDRLKWTEEDWGNSRVEHEEHKNKNTEEYRSRLAIRKEIIAMTSLAYGENSLVEKYLKRNEPPRWLQYDIESAYRLWKEAKAEEAKKDKIVEADKTEVKLNEEAVIWLQTKGKVLGTDFNLQDAISTANELAADEEIASLRASDELHSFVGEDNCEGCGGWDGSSHRCECGNRRVSWTVDSDMHSFKSPCVYGEAN